MNTHVTVNLDPAALGLTGPAVTFEFSAEFHGADDDEVILEAVWAICNPSAERFAAPQYRPIIEQYRERKHRSLSVGDTVTLGNHNDTSVRTYRALAIGWEEVK